MVAQVDQACPARMQKLGAYHSSEIPKAIYILYFLIFAGVIETIGIKKFENMEV
ncbi:hypothetical protein LL127_21660 (plasmid) [Clostridium estertheticum]|uniref:hypothetical protein n=1 Tax=Clostridium estertheticum TaxID=238834 RepID=UPI001CF29FB5|nr:hypothetical protein [Clostridium estertheticum]MCB2307376.1 hypothetical protein [Clostridium estertheticum]MCB2345026.1 hypothetical protein [Clostridium estertheticum]WAG48260.1 hypothetical protein LL127_21660 [Clostridium estertheticum]